MQLSIFPEPAPAVSLAGELRRARLLKNGAHVRLEFHAHAPSGARVPRWGQAQVAYRVGRAARAVCVPTRHGLTNVDGAGAWRVELEPTGGGRPGYLLARPAFEVEVLRLLLVTYDRDGCPVTGYRVALA